MTSSISSTVLNRMHAAVALHNNTSIPSDHHGSPLQFQPVNQFNKEPNAENMAEKPRYRQSMTDHNRTKSLRTVKRHQSRNTIQHTRTQDMEPMTTRRQRRFAQLEPLQQSAPRCIDTRLHDSTWDMNSVMKRSGRDQYQDQDKGKDQGKDQGKKIVHSTWTADRLYRSVHTEDSNHPVHPDIGQQQRQKEMEQVQRYAVVSHDKEHPQILSPSYSTATGGAKQGIFRFFSKVWIKSKPPKSPSSSPSKSLEPAQTESTSENISEKRMVRSKDARPRRGHGFIDDSMGANSRGRLAADSLLQSSTSTIALHTPGAPSYQYGIEKWPNNHSKSSFDFDHDLSVWQNHNEKQGEPSLVSSSPAQTLRSHWRFSKDSSRTASSFRRRSIYNHRNGHGSLAMDDGAKIWPGFFNSASNTGSSARSSCSSLTLGSFQQLPREKNRRSKHRTTDSVRGSPLSSKEISSTNIEKLTQIKNTGPRRLSIVVVGGGAVGKSALTIRFLRDQFHDEYDPTIEDSYCKYIVIDGTEYTLDITDTAGQSEYRGHWNDQFMREGDGFICVYSIASQESFKELTSFRDQIWSAKECEQVPMIMVGNKCDLERKGVREVSTAVGAQFAQQSNALFMETSAKTGVNIQKMIVELVRGIERRRQVNEHMENSIEVAQPTKSMKHSTNAVTRPVMDMDMDVKKGHCGCSIM